MKRYFCTVATGIVLALVGTGTATAGLPLPGGSGTQLVTFGDQTVGEQKNDADVTQAQGNGNLNIAPAVAIFGNAGTWNAQGNGNTATADVDQSNSVEQSQTSSQKQQGASGCCRKPVRCAPTKQWNPEPCSAPERTAAQTVEGGDQSVEKQRNDADVTQKQGNGNVSFAPAISLLGGDKGHSCSEKCAKSPRFGGGAKSTNAQGNWNDAAAQVDQGNSVDQSQTAYQRSSVVDSCKGLIER
jgi:hypothetical protein